MSPLSTLGTEAALRDPKTPQEYIAAWFQARNLPVNSRGEILFTSRRDNKAAVLNQIQEDYANALRERKLEIKLMNDTLLPRDRVPLPMGFSRAEIDTSFAIYLKNESDKAFEKLKAQIAYSKAAADSGEIERLLGILKDEVTELDVAVFKHLIWQVKRHMWNEKTRHELIISFLGKQGAGKTTLVRMLAEPIEDLFVERSMREIVGDERNSFMLQKAYLVLFEELENASRVDIDSLKALTSKNNMNWRMLGKNQDDNGYMNSTFVCTSNKALRQVFYDPTGMRRFYEFKVVDEIPRRAIKTIDFTMIWQSVDETAECPIEGRIKELYDYQNHEYRSQTTVEAFLDEEGYRPVTDGSKVTALKVIYADYKRFCEVGGFKNPVSSHTFSHEMQNLGHNKRRTNVGVVFAVEKAPRASNVLSLPTVK